MLNNCFRQDSGYRKRQELARSDHSDLPSLRADRMIALPGTMHVKRNEHAGYKKNYGQEFQKL